MRTFVIASLGLIAIAGIVLLGFHQAYAVPVNYNTTAVTGITWSNVPRNSSSYDIFLTKLSDTFLFMKFNNNTADSSPYNNAATITYNSNLVRLYKFEQNLNDSKSGVLNGTLTGTANYTGGHEGYGFNFNDGYVTVGNANNLGFSKSNAFSFSFWEKSATTSLPNTGEIFAKGTGTGTNYGYQLQIGTDGRFELNFYTSGGTLATAFADNILDGNWHFVTVTYNGSGNYSGVKVYDNGVFLGSGAAVAITGDITSASKFVIGAFSDGTNPLRNITVDELRAYSSTLTANQILGLYEIGKYQQSHTFDGGEYLTDGTTGSWSMLSDGSAFSTSVWVKAPSGSLITNPIIYGTSSTTNPSTGSYVEISSAGTVTFAIDCNNVSAPCLNVSTSSGAFPADGTYHQIDTTFDGTTGTIYIDGVSKGSATKSGTFIKTGPTYTMTIGTNPALSGNTFTGQLDDFVISDTAWTAAQVTSYYSAEFTSSSFTAPFTIMSWYHGVSGSATATKILGIGRSSLTLACTWQNTQGTPIANGTSIYYSCGSSATNSFYYNSALLNTNTYVFRNGYDTTSRGVPFINQKQYYGMSVSSYDLQITNANGNFTICQNPSAGCSSTSVINSNNKLGLAYSNGTNYVIRENFNNTGAPSPQNVSLTNTCDYLYTSTNATQRADDISCDRAFPANSFRYVEGQQLYNNFNYKTNSSLLFYNTINLDTHKDLLTIPNLIYGLPAASNARFIMPSSATSYFVIVTGSKIYYADMAQINSQLLNQNRAFETFLFVPYGNIDALMGIPSSGMHGGTYSLYGTNLNSTAADWGLQTIPSGYTVKGSSVVSTIRTSDPRWLNDANNTPLEMTNATSSFQMFITISNAPADAAMMLSNQESVINSLNTIWCVPQLDSTHSTECDIPVNECPLIYIADISHAPSVWNYQGSVCANGNNQKTVAYTATLPLNFYNFPFGASESYTAPTNILQTTVRATTPPFTYNIVIKNSNGTVKFNDTFTSADNFTQQSFNLTNVTKPASLAISVGKQQIYTSYLGSSVSFASVASAFHQLFNYQGFDLLSFIPLIFASMFTRNNVGIGMALTVIFIACLNFLSVVVVPDTYIFIAMLVAVMGMIGYRGIYG